MATFGGSTLSIAPGLAWLNDGGVVDRILGAAPDPEYLEQILALEVDARGRILALDRRTAAVHVFDSDGKWLRVCVPEPQEFHSHNYSSPQVRVSCDGDIHMTAVGNDSDERSGRFLRFSSQGQPLGVERLDLDTITQTWRFHPNSAHRWVVGYKQVFLVDQTNKVLRTITRCADDRWLDDIDVSAVGRDGSLAVVARGAINLYAADGSAIRSIPLDQAIEPLSAGMSFDGKRLAVVSGDDIYLLDSAGTGLHRFSPTKRDSSQYTWEPLLRRERPRAAAL